MPHRLVVLTPAASRCSFWSLRGRTGQSEPDHHGQTMAILQEWSTLHLHALEHHTHLSPLSTFSHWLALNHVRTGAGWHGGLVASTRKRHPAPVLGKIVGLAVGDFHSLALTLQVSEPERPSSAQRSEACHAQGQRGCQEFSPQGIDDLKLSFSAQTHVPSDVWSSTALPKSWSSRTYC